MRSGAYEREDLSSATRGCIYLKVPLLPSVTDTLCRDIRPGQGAVTQNPSGNLDFFVARAGTVASAGPRRTRRTAVQVDGVGSACCYRDRLGSSGYATLTIRHG
ncbi:MAG TPA: hypothetical protein PLR18_03220 [bacterium]|nr:hypothetical protein [bacterium]